MHHGILLEVADHVATITLNRPDTRNAIDGLDMVDALVATVERVNADPQIRCAILTGAGSAFCAGGNLKLIEAAEGDLDPRNPARIRFGYRQGIQRIPAAFEALDVPIIAAINGPAVGAGCDLACMCDIRIAGESARFAESFIRLGLVPGDGGAWLLPRAVGYAKAAEMALTGDMIDAADALASGMVSRVVPDADLMTVAKMLAAKIATHPPHALRMTKRLLREGRQSDLNSALQMAAAMQSLLHASQDHRRALTALLHKTTASYTGE
jgi:enoyl-CoA hydratase/carnithine racemase